MGSDWTRLLTDLDLVSHLGPLLQTYRQVSPEQREATLLQAMREIKEEAARSRESKAGTQVQDPTCEAASSGEWDLTAPEPATTTPPFEPSSVPTLSILWPV